MRESQLGEPSNQMEKPVFPAFYWLIEKMLNEHPHVGMRILTVVSKPPEALLDILILSRCQCGDKLFACHCREAIADF